MTIKKLISLLKENMKDGFIVSTNKEKDYNFLKDNEIILSGENEKEVFTLIINKVY